MLHPIQILERYWKYTSFRSQQEQIINAVLQNDDVLALLPTGGGKSLCFQIPALAREGICIVISPLIALINNQVEDLQNRGIKAIGLTNIKHRNELDALLDNCIYGNYKFLYISPERLENELVQERIKLMNVNLIAVDEAHCISQWGHDFRPAYRNITKLRLLKPNANVIALTASATLKVEHDIINTLDFIKPKLFKQSFKRDNLAYMTFDAEDKLHLIKQILTKNKSSSIIYVRNRKGTFETSEKLNDIGILSTFYHGGMSNDDKDTSFKLWFNNAKQAMVATSAFGMGIDKPDVSSVIHINFPESIESYFQEAGRAGRNGNKAYAIILRHKGDEAQLKKQFLDNIPSITQVKFIYKKLCNYFQIPFGEGVFFSSEFNYLKFCNTYKLNKGITFNTLKILDQNSIINISPEFRNNTTIQILISNTALFSYISKNKEINTILKTILRSYGGVFEQPTKIDTKFIAKKAAVSEPSLITCLEKLEKDAVIKLKLIKTDIEITFVEPREDDITINRIAKTIVEQNEIKKNQIDAVLNYIYNDNLCKSIQLLSYFGEKNVKQCGICSVCIKNKPLKVNKDELNSILAVLKNKPQRSRQISTTLQMRSDKVNFYLKKLLELNKIEITSNNTYQIK